MKTKPFLPGVFLFVGRLKVRRHGLRRRVGAGIAGAGLAVGGSLAPATHTQVVINEFMASNGATIADEDGDFEDWIELYHAGSEAVNLQGYGLTDDPQTPRQWVFPPVTLRKGGHLLLWASGKNRGGIQDRDQSPGGAAPVALHANFKIHCEGETLQLSAPDGRVVDRVLPVASLRDVSWGRQSDGAGTWLYFPTSTPGKANAGVGFGQILAAPEFSQPGGFYTQPLQVTLSSPDPAAVILYTLDGSEPDPGNLEGSRYSYKNQYPEEPGDPFGPLLWGSCQTLRYTGAIAIVDRSAEPDRLSQRSTTWQRSPESYLPLAPVFKGTVVRARALREGYLPSRVATETFLVTPAGHARYGLPAISLALNEEFLFGYERGIYCAGIDYDTWRAEHPDSNAPWRPLTPANYHRTGQAWEYPVNIEMFVGATAAVFRAAAGLRIHGRDSRMAPQKSLRLQACDADGSTGVFAHAFFGGPARKSDELPVDQFTGLLLQSAGKYYDVIAHRIMAPAALDVQRSRPVVQFFNGEFWGIGYLRDCQDEHHLASEYGLEGDDLIILREPVGGGVADNVEVGHPDDILLYREMFEYATTADTASENYYPQIASWLDVNSYLDYNVMYIYLNQSSWQGRQHFRYWRVRHPRDQGYADGRWRLMVWDLDWFTPDPTYDYLRSAIDPEGEAEADWARFGGDPARTLLLRSLLRNAAFRVRFINRFAYHMNATLRPIGAAPYPWTGCYFGDVPVAIEAVPVSGSRLLRWEGCPGATTPVMTLLPRETASVVAAFDPDPGPLPRALIHYWSFNDAGRLTEPAWTLGGTRWVLRRGAETEAVSGSGQGFTGANARLGDAAGLHLRINQPLGSSLTFHLPTTGFADIVVRYETRRSGQGAGIQELAFTTNGTQYVTLSAMTVLDDEPMVHTLDFTGIAGVAGNPDFAVQITFARGKGGTAGNNRFDNLTVEGRGVGTVNRPPEVGPLPGVWRLIEGGEPAVIDLTTVFRDPDGDRLTCRVEAVTPAVVEGVLEGTTLRLWPRRRGESGVRVTASDERHEAVQVGLRVLVYPAAQRVAEGAYFFGSWEGGQPEGVYPEHMLFLQSEGSDPGLESTLERAYWISPEEYHADDRGKIGYPYNNTRRTRINGLGADGVSFINTGRERDLGGALLALDTRGSGAVYVRWLGGTVRASQRTYALRLQYRVGIEGPFLDVLHRGQPVEYDTGADGEVQWMGPVPLPESALGVAHLQLLWRYYHVAGDSGTRDELRLDEVRVAASEAEFEPALAVGKLEKGQLMLTWPVAPGWELQSSDQLGPPAVWAPVQVSAIVVGDRWVVTLALDPRSRFFRLTSARW